MTETATKTQRAGGSLAAGEGAEREGERTEGRDGQRGASLAAESAQPESRALKGWVGRPGEGRGAATRSGCGS